MVNLHDIKREYDVDPFLRRLKSRVTTGDWKSCSQLERQFAKHKDKLTVEEGVVYQGTRMVILMPLHQRVMDLAHETHGGVNSTLRRLQFSAWWPGMASDVNFFVARCRMCNLVHPRLSSQQISGLRVPLWIGGIWIGRGSRIVTSSSWWMLDPVGSKPLKRGHERVRL